MCFMCRLGTNETNATIQLLKKLLGGKRNILQCEGTENLTFFNLLIYDRYM